MLMNGAATIDTRLHHSIPAELRRLGPRPVQSRPGRLHYSIVVARIFLVPIALLGLYLAARVVIYALVITRGEQITGTLERTGVNKSQQYLVYSYEAGGQSHSGSRDISAQG